MLAATTNLAGFNVSKTLAYPSIATQEVDLQISKIGIPAAGTGRAAKHGNYDTKIRLGKSPM